MKQRTALSPWPTVLCLPLGILGAVLARYAVLLPVVFDDIARAYPAVVPHFILAGFPGTVRQFQYTLAAAGAAVLLVSVLGLLLRGKRLLAALRWAYVTAYVVFFQYCYVVVRGTATVMAGGVEIGGSAPNPVMVFFWRWHWMAPACAAVAAIAVVHLLSWCRTPMAAYTGLAQAEPAAGDRILRNLRTHGRYPLFRKSLFGSMGAHITILLLLPWLLAFRGCMQPYAVPKGSGTPGVEAPAVKIVKIQKKPTKKRTRYLLNPQSAISFHVPKIDESEVFDDVEKDTAETYQAQNQKVGKLGAGGGKEGGWPNGMDKAKVRFIRLQYTGGDWDQDMGIGADYNMLLEFHRITGFNVAPNTESIAVGDLLRFPKNRAPPFVYMTGGLKGSISMGPSEIKALRKYCLELGGMLFADNGGGNFDSSFRPLLRRVFPDLPLVEIAYDDTVFRYPYEFPNGAPPLWHHSGNRALGVKYKGRWVVFYHQGDINDAWKDGHSGASGETAAQAYKLGVNVINYSFNQYMSLNFGDGVPR